MVIVMVGVELGGNVISNVSGTGVGGRDVLVAIATTGVLVSAGKMGGRLTSTVGRGEGMGVLVPSGGCGTKAGLVPLPPMRMTRVATNAATTTALSRNAKILPGKNRRARRVSSPNMPAQAK